ncbi:MAG: ribbon-helix-helix domain-containing protein [Bryobacterales bacterium]|nr:ribbon-helix-helix domain-containing protein [Bryobacterales bacterium]
MPNTSVYFPQSVLSGLNRVAEERGMSRNRLIVEACRRVVEERTCWPADLFSNDHLSQPDLELLREGQDPFLDAISSARRSRARSPF